MHTIGTQQGDPHPVLPVDKIIQYHLESKDVIHSFWVPDFLFKRDVFPSPAANQVDDGDKFQNIITVQGAMVGRCAELCGQYHSMMNFEVRGVPQPIFDHYIDLREQINPATSTAVTPHVRGADRDELRMTLCATGTATTNVPFDTRREADNLIAGGK